MEASMLNYDAASPIKVAAPPNIMSVFPKGVSIASKATVPTITNLLIERHKNSLQTYVKFIPNKTYWFSFLINCFQANIKPKINHAGRR